MSTFNYSNHRSKRNLVPTMPTPEELEQEGNRSMKLAIDLLLRSNPKPESDVERTARIYRQREADEIARENHDLRVQEQRRALEFEEHNLPASLRVEQW